MSAPSEVSSRGTYTSLYNESELEYVANTSCYIDMHK
jgi:hypothetical protein